MLLEIKNLGCNISMKLHSHIDYFQHNFGDLSREQGEGFHQDMRTM